MVDFVCPSTTLSEVMVEMRRKSLHGRGRDGSIYTSIHCDVRRLGAAVEETFDLAQEISGSRSHVLIEEVHAIESVLRSSHDEDACYRITATSSF